MNRQSRRRIKREWKKIPYYSDCTDKIDNEDLRNTLINFLYKINDNLLLQFNLDMFYRWRMYPIVVVDGLHFRDSFFDIDMPSIEWAEDYFNGEQYEGYNRFA